MALVYVIVFPVIWPARELDPVDGTVTFHREHAGCAHRFHARQAGEAAGNLSIKPKGLFVTLVDSTGSHDSQGCEVVRIETHRHVQEAVQAFSQQSGACQQHYRDGQFHDPEMRAKPTPEQASNGA